jgi:hypothetical protein
MKSKIFSYISSAIVIAWLLTGCEDDAGTVKHNPSAPIEISGFLPVSGGGGTEVLINGSNFSPDISEITATLNGHPLKVVGSNDHQLMVVIPKKADSGKIVVSIGGKSSETPADFTYVYTRTVSTLAGNGTAGFANGNGTDAMFNFNGQEWYRSMGIAVDDDLNLYVADPGNHCIRKIDSLGNVTTLAGDPNTSGWQDGQKSGALFSLPYDVAVDDDGTVYSVDPGNWDIRKITPDGTATTIGWGGGAPWSVSIDKTTGKVYYSVHDSNGRVYEVGNGTAIISNLNWPGGIEFDKNGNLFVSMNGDHVVRRFAAGTWEGSVVAGQVGVAGYLNGPASSAKFSLPWGLTLDADGNIYLAGNGSWNGGTDNPDQSIRFIKAGTGEVSTFAGSGSAGFADAIGEAAAFKAPGGVAVDKNGTVYVLDKHNNRIRKIVSE